MRLNHPPCEARAAISNIEPLCYASHTGDPLVLKGGIRWGVQGDIRHALKAGLRCLVVRRPSMVPFHKDPLE